MPFCWVFEPIRRNQWVAPILIALACLSVPAGCGFSSQTHSRLFKELTSDELRDEAANEVGASIPFRGSRGSSVSGTHAKSDFRFSFEGPPELLGRFMLAYQKRIHHRIEQRGASIRGWDHAGEKEAPTDFSFSYAGGSQAGFVEVISVKTADENYTIIVLAYEGD